MINPALGGYRDNRELEKRDDVLTFTGPPLTESLDVIGNPVVELMHHTDNPHADLFVRLCEVRKNGRSINVSDGFQRLDPDKSNGSILLRLDAMAHRFTPGTRIRLQISGGAHPRYARNMGTGEDQATSSHLVPSRRTVFHGDGGFSRIFLPCQLGVERDRAVQSSSWAAPAASTRRSARVTNRRGQLAEMCSGFLGPDQVQPVDRLSAAHQPYL